jgi:NAD(P)-dependent dehydrogenase (short-subunit alcohol dehydrogenase family)
VELADHPRFPSQGKVVLVTGGAKGIGRMISEGYVQNGAKVYISSRDAKACQLACNELNALGKGQAFAIPADFYKEEDCKKLADELAKREKSEFTCRRLRGVIVVVMAVSSSSSSSSSLFTTGPMELILCSYCRATRPRQ